MPLHVLRVEWALWCQRVMHAQLKGQWCHPVLTSSTELGIADPKYLENTLGEHLKFRLCATWRTCKSFITIRTTLISEGTLQVKWIKLMIDCPQFVYLLIILQSWRKRDHDCSGYFLLINGTDLTKTWEMKPFLVFTEIFSCFQFQV